MADALAVLEHARPEAGQWSALLASPASTDKRFSPGRSGFETLARLSARPWSHLGQVLHVLLASACTGASAGPPLLQPIWAEEAINRSCAMMRLLEACQRRGNDPAASQVQQNLAEDLAARFRALDDCSASEVLPCSSLLRDVVADLVALFTDMDDVILSTNIEHLRLPAHKRRALILVTVEPVMNALLHAFPGGASGRIEVTLELRSSVRAWLQVKDDRVGFVSGWPNLPCSLAARLVDLLEADLVYMRKSSLTDAETSFPVGVALSAR